MSNTYKSISQKGAGDGVKEEARTPVPSSRKFTIARNQYIQLKLKQTEEKNEQPFKQLKKAKTVSEITPTKTRPKHLKLATGLIALHGTPRRPEIQVKNNHWEEIVCRRIFLALWRRNRDRFKETSESLQNQLRHISNLTNQIDLLKKLNISEQKKSDNAAGSCIKAQKDLQDLSTKHTEILAKKAALEAEFDNLGKFKDQLIIQVENLKQEVKAKNIHIKNLENNQNTAKTLLIKLKTDNKILESEQIKQLQLIKEQQKIIKTSQEDLESNKKQLREIKQDKDTLKTENKSINEEMIQNKKCTKAIEEKILDLENQLSIICFNYEEAINENEALKKNLKNANFWKVSEAIVKWTWLAVQKSAYLMLPALQF